LGDTEVPVFISFQVFYLFAKNYFSAAQNLGSEVLYSEGTQILNQEVNIMAIMLGITEKGIKDVCIVANSLKEGKKLTDLYNFIDPEVNAFEDLINEKLREYKKEEE
jgi:hypothetical protein